MHPRVSSEMGVLRAVLLAAPHDIDYEHDPINAVQHHFYAVKGDRPDPDRLAHQHADLAEILTAHDVTIVWADPIPKSPEQHFTRDVSMVIDDRFVINRFGEPVREPEIAGLAPLLESLETAPLRASQGVVEGGDVLIDGERLYIGMGDRTDAAGVDWLREHFGTRYEVIPVQLAPDILHLDVVFNLVGHNVALAYPPALPPDFMAEARQRFDVIEVTSDEQFGLATNVFSISPDHVIADVRFTRVNDEMRHRGITIIPVEYDEIAKMGGSLRCTTCPLIREAL